jgi:hypothetical protein
VTGELESARHEPAEIPEAGLRFEHAPALLALEMVMMPFSGQLEARCLAGETDRDHDPLFSEGLDGTVNGGDTEAVLLRLRGTVDLFDRHRTIGAAQHIMNRLQLSGVPDPYGHPDPHYPPNGGSLVMVLTS